MNANEQERRLIQAVVAKTGPLVGKSIRDIKFRTRYNAVVLAVHREGVRVHARIGDVVLHPGDVLLLDAGPDFHREASHGGSGFALVSVLEDSAPPRLRLLVPVLFIAVAMIISYTAGLTELIVAALFAAGIMMCVGALSGTCRFHYSRAGSRAATASARRAPFLEDGLDFLSRGVRFSPSLSVVQ